MTLSIRHARANALARQLANETGKPITTVIIEALEDYAARHAPQADNDKRFSRLMTFLEEADRLPVKDPRSAKEIMDDLYDEHGLPK